MKRKWIWALTALLLSVGFVLVKRVADKRPRVMARDVETPTLVVSPIADERAILVARDVEASLLEVSPDGQLLFAHSEAQQSATVIGLKEDLRVVIPVDYNPVSAFFSADSRRIYEIYNQPDVNADGIDVHFRISGHDARTGKSAREFVFPLSENIYGAYARGTEILVESKQKTWRLDERTLRVLGTRPQKRTTFDETLIPDGKTLFTLDAQHNTFKFKDLITHKLLWQIRDNEWNSVFSPDGRTVLTQKNNEIVARDTRTGDEQWRLRGPQSSVVALSPDEKTLYRSAQKRRIMEMAALNR